MHTAPYIDYPLSEQDRLLRDFRKIIEEFNNFAPATVYDDFLEAIRQHLVGKRIEIKDSVSRRYFIWKVKNVDAEILFQEPLEIQIEKEDDLFFVNNYELNIFGHGETKEEALKDFYDFFIFDYFNYKNTSSNELSVSAKRLIASYDRYVKEVERYESSSKS